VPKFTANGWALRRLPDTVFAKLSTALNKALENWDAIPEVRGHNCFPLSSGSTFKEVCVLVGA
jgi:hypothetical protein